MAFPVLYKQVLSSKVKRFDIYAPQIANKIQPGQYVKVCFDHERFSFPMNVVDHDAERGSITLIVHEVGEKTRRFGTLSINSSVDQIVGPLGRSIEIPRHKTALFVTSGIGVAHLLPLCRAYVANRNKTVGIMGAKTKKKIILEPQFRLACNDVLIATRDGSYEAKGTAAQLLQNYLHKHRWLGTDLGNLIVFVSGSVDLLQNVREICGHFSVPSYFYLTPRMQDCTGLCGTCRVIINEEKILSCLEGPLFEANSVDLNQYAISLGESRRLKTSQSEKTECPSSKKDPSDLSKIISAIIKN